MKNSIRQKLIWCFTLITLLMIFTSFYTYLNAKILTVKMNTMFISNVNLNNLKKNIDVVEKNLEKYLETKRYDILNNYYNYSDVLRDKSTKIKVDASSRESRILIEDIKNIIYTYISETDATVLAKKGRNIQGTVSHYNEAIKNYGYINSYIEKLNNKQLEENTGRYMVFLKRIGLLQITNISVIIGVVIFSFILILWFSYSLTNPLVKLSQSAEKVSEGNFDIQEIQVNTDDEISVMANAFNRMISSIRSYIGEIKEKAELKNLLKEAELKALQAQINPHFLFNSLNAGAQMALMEGAEKTSIFIDNIASLARYNLRKLDKPVMLQDEIENIKTYIFIMKTRFSDRVKYLVQTDPQLPGVEMPCMILQPIVENAFIHGIGDMEDGGTIRLRIENDGDFIKISIWDNGKGMSQETVRNILDGNREGQTKKDFSKHKEVGGIGVTNVVNRLRLFYGREDVIEVKSELGYWSEFILRIPVRNFGGDTGV